MLLCVVGIIKAQIRREVEVKRDRQCSFFFSQYDGGWSRLEYESDRWSFFFLHIFI